VLLRAERQRRWLGALWWVLEPASSFVVFWVVFQLGLRAGGDGPYLENLAIGLLTWRWFEVSILQGANSLVTGRHEYLDAPIPKAVYPMASWFLATAKFLPVFLSLVLVLKLAGRIEMGLVGFAGVLAGLAAQGVFILGSALFLAAVVPFLPDLRQVVELLVRLQFFVSNVVFPLALLPDPIEAVAAANPMTVLIRSLQDSAIHGAGAGASLFYPAAIGILGFALGLSLLSRLSGEYGKLVV
jgi:lipopolysaccharide transport system permease protein